jgi:hypothetical protein
MPTNNLTRRVDAVESSLTADELEAASARLEAERPRVAALVNLLVERLDDDQLGVLASHKVWTDPIPKAIIAAVITEEDERRIAALPERGRDA